MDEVAFRREFLESLNSLELVRDGNTYLGPDARGGRRHKPRSRPDQSNGSDTRVEEKLEAGRCASYWSMLEELVKKEVGEAKAREIVLEMQRMHVKYITTLSMDEIEMMARNDEGNFERQRVC